MKFGADGAETLNIYLNVGAESALTIELIEIRRKQRRNTEIYKLFTAQGVANMFSCVK
jgi:hypothetical protein